MFHISGGQHMHADTQPIPEYSRKGLSYKLSNLLTKFFPAGRDRSHFFPFSFLTFFCLLSFLFFPECSVRGAELQTPQLALPACLMGSVCSPFPKLKTTALSPGDLRREWEETGWEGHSPSHSDLLPCSCFGSSAKLVSRL